MGNKIPVFGTVGAAYGFAIGRFTTLVRLSWFWTVAIVGASLYWGPTVMAAVIAGLKTGNTEGMEAALSAVQMESNGMQLVQLFGGVFVIVALLRAVISQNFRDGVPLHLISGMADLRVIGVAFLLLIAFAAGIIAFALAFGVVAGILNAAGVGAIAGFLAIGFALVFVWVMLRLSLVLPVASVESNLGVERSWSLMKGNSLRMFLAILFTFVPFALVAASLFGAIIGSSGIFENFPKIDPAHPEAFKGVLFPWMVVAFESIVPQFPVIVVVGSVFEVISRGLWAGLLGHAYRSVTGMNDASH